MMATTVILRDVIKQVNGTVLVNFEGGSQLEFTSLAALQEWARQADASVDLTQQLCVAYALARSADLSNVATVRNKDFTFDLSVNSPIRVQ